MSSIFCDICLDLTNYKIFDSSLDYSFDWGLLHWCIIFRATNFSFNLVSFSKTLAWNTVLNAPEPSLFVYQSNSYLLAMIMVVLLIIDMKINLVQKLQILKIINIFKLFLNLLINRLQTKMINIIIYMGYRTNGVWNERNMMVK